MAKVKRRTRARFANPIRTAGALIVNPRKKRASAKKRRKASTVKRRPNTLLVRANKRRARKSNRKLRKNTVYVRANKARRTKRRSVARKMNPVYVRVNSKRRRSRSVKRNSLYVRANKRHRLKRHRNSGAAAKAKGFLGKIPLVGGLLSSILGLVMPAALGALSVEPAMMAAKYLGPRMPSVPTSIFYPAAGLVIAGLLKAFGSKLLGSALADKLAIAAASSGGAIGYYKFRTGQDQEAAAEAGMLELAGLPGYNAVAGFADGFATRVVPFQ